MVERVQTWQHKGCAERAVIRKKAATTAMMFTNSLGWIDALMKQRSAASGLWR